MHERERAGAPPRRSPPGSAARARRRRGGSPASPPRARAPRSGSRRQRLLPRRMPAAARICSGGTREAPRTSTAATAKRGVVRTQSPAPTIAAAVSATAAASPPARADQRDRPRAAPAPRRGPRAGRRRDAERSPRSARAARRRPRRDELGSTHRDPDLGLERDAEVRLHALARHLHQGQDVGGRRAAAVDDEVGVLGRDLGAVDPLALEPDLLDRAARPRRSGGFFHTQPAEASASGCVDFFTLSRCLMSFWISAQRPAMQLQAAADQHRAPAAR